MKEAWAVKPKDISEDQIVCTHYADIVIIGAGHAGTCAARAAAEAGANVFVLEQQERDKQWVLGIGEIGLAKKKPEVTPAAIICSDSVFYKRNKKY